MEQCGRVREITLMGKGYYEGDYSTRNSSSMEGRSGSHVGPLLWFEGSVIFSLCNLITLSIFCGALGNLK